MGFVRASGDAQSRQNLARPEQRGGPYFYPAWVELILSDIPRVP